MEKTGWKVLAIVFICLFVVETALLVATFGLGIKEINNENACVELCSTKQECESYAYSNGVCKLYAGDKIIYSEIIS